MLSGLIFSGFSLVSFIIILMIIPYELNNNLRQKIDKKSTLTRLFIIIIIINNFANSSKIIYLIVINIKIGQIILLMKIGNLKKHFHYSI